MFAREIVVRLEHTDAAGVLYFAEGLKLCHQVYEAFLDEHQLSVRYILTEASWALPIVHAALTLKKPAFVGDVLTVQMQLREKGERSFHIAYRASRGDDPVFDALTAHVAIDKASAAPIELPAELSQALGESVQAP